MATPIPINRAKFSAAEIAEATGGTLRGQSSLEAVGVATDSRAIQPGNVFVALRGERFDAHAFVQDAVRAGSVAVVVDREVTVPSGACVIEVDDTLVALGALAERYRKAWTGTLIAITGSAGKTTTKELIAAALEGAGVRAFKAPGNLNNRIGVPMVLFQLDAAFDAAVVELGTSAQGEIATLAKMSRPDVAVITLVSAAHTEGLGSFEAVAEEKVSLFDHVSSEGQVIFNGDDPMLRAMSARWASRRQTTFGSHEDCTVRIAEWTVTNDGTRARFVLPPPVGELEVELALLGESAVINAAAALAVVVAMRLPFANLAAALRGVAPVAGRMAPVRARNGALVLDDSYNANPRSTDVALSTAQALAESTGRRLVVVLGDMKELGSLSNEEHLAVGSQVAASNAALFVACGAAMRAAAERAKRHGTSAVRVDHADVAARTLLEKVEANDLVLVKGSRSMQMERVVDALVSGEVQT